MSSIEDIAKWQASLLARDDSGEIADIETRLRRLEAVLSGVTNISIMNDTTGTQRWLVQHFSANAVFTAGGATVTFPTAFPTLCDGALWMFDNSVGASSISVVGLGVRAASTVGLVATGGTATLGVVVWAWGH